MTAATTTTPAGVQVDARGRYLVPGRVTTTDRVSASAFLVAVGIGLFLLLSLVAG